MINVDVAEAALGVDQLGLSERRASAEGEQPHRGAEAAAGVAQRAVELTFSSSVV
jgi:hypothetical protein